MNHPSLLILLCAFAATALGQSGSFVPTGNMTTQRGSHTATALPDGRVLLTGGTNGRGTILASAEIYDPITGTFQLTGNMSRPRFGHSAILLPDGRVLIVGSDGPGFEIYDPTTGTFSPAPATGYQAWGRGAAVLPDGKVLIVGDNADRYDPQTGTADWLGTLLAGKTTAWQITAAVLPDSRIVANALDNVALFDPRGGTARLVEKHSLDSAYGATMTTLTNGQVFISGGYVDYRYDTLVQTQVLLYDPRSGSRPRVMSLLTSRAEHAATLLRDGKVLISGGYTDGPTRFGILGEAELFDPSNRTFTPGGTDSQARVTHTATLLQDGRVLLAGGLIASLAASLYIPETRAVSAASLAGTLAPGSLASVFGAQLSRTTAASDPNNPPTTLSGISLRVRDQSGAERPARLLYVSPAQINFEVPAETAPGGITVTVGQNGIDGAKGGGQISPIAPALFIAGNNTVAATRMADTVTLYATGIRNRSSLAEVQVEIGGIVFPADRASPDPNVPGLDEVTFRLPASLSGRGAVPLSMTVDGVRSNATYLELN